MGDLQQFLLDLAEECHGHWDLYGLSDEEEAADALLEWINLQGYDVVSRPMPAEED